MLENLQQILATQLPALLENREAWSSLIVNRRKPYTYRVFTQIGDLRCCLHKFDVCDTHEAFAHPHPWPGAFIIMQGRYKMNVGYSPDRFTKPADVLTTVQGQYSMYEITNPLTWHSVIPLEPTYTIMVNGEPWDTETIAHKDVRTTKGKDLDQMAPDELDGHLKIFKRLVTEYLVKLYAGRLGNGGRYD